MSYGTSLQLPISWIASGFASWDYEEALITKFFSNPPVIFSGQSMTTINSKDWNTEVYLGEFPPDDVDKVHEPSAMGENRLH